MVSNSALEHNISKVKVNQGGQKLNRACQPLVYTDDVKFTGENMDTRKNNTDNLLDNSQEA
jgi:hypothetical protein